MIACGLSAIKIYALDSHGHVFECIVFRLLGLLSYGVPAGLVLIAAHWAVVRSAMSARRCRWLEVHWLSWLAVVAVGGPLLHYSLMATTYAVYPGIPISSAPVNTWGWPLTYSHMDGPLYSLTGPFSPLALPVDVVIWLAITVATAFVVERWVRRVEQKIPMRPTAFYSFLFVACAVIWVLNNDHSWRPPWYDYLFWLLGMAGTVYAAEVLILGRLNFVARIGLVIGLCVGIPLWFALSHPIPDCGLLKGFALTAGAFAAAAVDAGYRLLSHPDKGAARFVRRDCGGCVAAAPLWIVATAGAIGGVLLIYWRS